MLAVGTASGAPAKRPTNAALRKAFERNRDTVVEVWSPRGRGIGVIVGGAGQIATSIDHVGLYAATVRLGGRDRPARVALADARLRIALLEPEIDPGERHTPVAVDARAELKRGTWLVGIDRPAGKRAAPTPFAGRILRSLREGDPFIVTDLPLRPGSPLFDVRGRLVAIAVERIGRIGSRAVAVSRLQVQVAGAAAP
jgi:S1-C subfamily serine protease